MYFILNGIASFIGILPEAFLEFVAKALAVVSFDVFRVRRRLMIKNILTAFPELGAAEAVRMARTSMIHLVMTFIELLWIWKNSYGSRIEVANPELLHVVLAQGKGAFILCTHTGNFEAFAALLSRDFAKVTSPVKLVGTNAGVNRFIAENRQKQGIDAIVRTSKGQGFKAIRRALNERRLVGFMMDQARPGEPRLPLFGKPAKTNTSLGAIWDKCQAPIVPGYCERIGFARHRVHFLPELSLQQTKDSDADILNHAVACNTMVEEIIRRCPQQYWWVHDRWK